MTLWLADYGRVALTLGLAGCLGYPLVRRVVPGRLAVPLSALMGLGLLSLAVCVMSWLHIFTGGSLAVLAALALAATAPCLAADLPRWWRSRTGSGDAALRICLAALLITVIGFSWYALYPVTVGDAVDYHLPLAHNLVAAHGLRYDPFVRYSFFPQANESLFAVILLLGGNGTAAGALEWGLVATAAFSLLIWFPASGRRPAAGLIAAFVLLGSPAVVWLGTSPMIDAGAMSFVLGGLILGLEVAEGRSPPLPGLFAAGLLFGVAAATKYTATAFDLAAVVAIVIAGTGRVRLATPVLGLICGALLTAVPWYAWTVHVAGDPAYPFATSLFGNSHHLWTVSEIQLQESTSRGGAQPGIGGILAQDARFLLGRVSFNTGLGRPPLSWWLAAGFLGLLLPGARRDRTFIALAVALLLAILVWVLSSADPRYFLPAAPLSVVLAGLATDHGLQFVEGRVGRRTRSMRLRPLWYALAGVVLLWTSVGFVTWYIGYSGGGPPTSGPAVSRYLGYKIFCYPAVDLLNAQFDTQYRAWSEDCEGARYYARGLLISDAFSVGGRDRILNQQGGLPPADILWHRLQPLHVRWMIVPITTRAERHELDARGLFAYEATEGNQQVFAVAPRLRGARRS